MTAQPHGEPRDRELERLLSRAERPVASPAFRERLRDEFLGPEVVQRVQRPAPRTRIFPFVWPLVVAASVAFLIYFVMTRDANLRWRVVGVDGGGEYLVDGRRVHSSEGPRLLDLVQTAHEIETHEAGLRLQLGDELVMELGPRTRVSQLSFPAASSYAAFTHTGALRLTTGPGFQNRLRVMTDDMETVVVGTTFGVDVESDGTCLCCVAGTVKCDARDGRGLVPTEAGRMCYAYHSGRKPLCGEVVPVHAEPLEKLKAFAAGAWKAPK